MFALQNMTAQERRYEPDVYSSELCKFASTKHPPTYTVLYPGYI